ncbi:MAG: molybdopterin-guanine dinucleotide biosynthesis protein B [Sarcina sp.]
MENKIINIVASCSNSGKTTLIEGIIKELKKDNCIISTIKHDVHGIDIDKKGKDTYRHREAGADNIIISSKKRLVLIKELQEETQLEQVLETCPDSDYIIIEGYKHSKYPKIEVFRKGISQHIITPKSKLVAIATDDMSLKIDVPIVDLNNYREIADFIKNFSVNKFI